MDRKHLIVIIAVIALLATQVFSWDGQRNGFILGIGLGSGYTSYNYKVEDNGTERTTSRESALGPASIVKIGYAPDNTYLIYFMSNSTWFTGKDINGDNFKTSSDFTGAAVSYYFKERTPSFYVTGGFGGGSWNGLFTGMDSEGIGIGFLCGAGYEFTKHWSGEINLSFGMPVDSDPKVRVTTKYISVNAGITLLAF